MNLRSVLSDKSGSPPTEQQVKLTGFETTTKEVVSNLFLLISASSPSDPAQMLWNRVKAENLSWPQKRQSPRKLLSGDCIQKDMSANHKWTFDNILSKSFLISSFQVCNIENCPGEDKIEMCRTWFSLDSSLIVALASQLLAYWSLLLAFVILVKANKLNLTHDLSNLTHKAHKLLLRLSSRHGRGRTVLHQGLRRLIKK